MMLTLLAMAERTKPLTSVEKAEAKRLKLRWDQKRRELGLTQERLGALMGVGQSTINEWLNGRKRISDWTLLRFSLHLQFDPDEVRAGVLDRLPRAVFSVGLSDEDAEFAKEFAELSPKDKELVKSMMALLRARGRS